MEQQLRQRGTLSFRLRAGHTAVGLDAGFVSRLGSNMSSDLLEHTGERMIPEASVPEIFWEHVHRYRFAKRFVRDKRVLDIACGEGYGAFGLLRAGAASVVGVDISEEACDNARQKYGIDARCGSAEAIPLPDASVDVVVSFE